MFAPLLLALPPTAETTRPLTPQQMNGIRVWDQAPTNVTRGSKPDQLKFSFQASFKNETPQELASLSVRMIIELSGSRAFTSPPLKLTKFSNLSVPVDGALEPFNKTGYVQNISFEAPANLWRTDSHRYLQVSGGTTFVNPDLHDAGHLYTRLMNGKDEEEIEMLKKDPSLLKVRNEQNFTPILMAFATCGPKMVQYLLAHGSSAKAATTRGATIMHMAALNGYPGVCDLALKLGGDVNAKTKNGKTPLTKAIVHGSPVTWRWLLKHGADPSYTDPAGWNVAHYAIQEGQKEALADLTAAGARVQAKDQSGAGWMHYAVFNYMMMGAVKKAGVPVDDPNSVTGQTPLMLAAWSGWEEPQVWLLQHGADPNRKDKKGKTAVDYARQRSKDYGVDYFDSLVQRYGKKR